MKPVFRKRVAEESRVHRGQAGNLNEWRELAVRKATGEKPSIKVEAWNWVVCWTVLETPAQRPAGLGVWQAWFHRWRPWPYWVLWETELGEPGESLSRFIILNRTPWLTQAPSDTQPWIRRTLAASLSWELRTSWSPCRTLGSGQLQTQAYFPGNVADSQRSGTCISLFQDWAGWQAVVVTKISKCTKWLKG